MVCIYYSIVRHISVCYFAVNMFRRLANVFKVFLTKVYKVLISGKKKRGWYMAISAKNTQPLYKGQLTFK